MAANVLQPFGAQYARNWQGAAPTVQFQQYFIKKGATAVIGYGDLVSVGSGGSQGYVVPATFNTPPYLGIFMGVLPYFDLTFQSTQHGGLMGSFPATVNPAADVPCLVCTDPGAAFRMQVSGGPFVQAWVSNNINILTGTIGVPGTNGISTMVLDGASPATTSTFPFRVLGVAGVTGSPFDPANTNPVIEVAFNFGATMMQVATGI